MTSVEQNHLAVGEVADVIVGYLITLRDGFECRMGPDHEQRMFVLMKEII